MPKKKYGRAVQPCTRRGTLVVSLHRVAGRRNTIQIGIPGMQVKVSPPGEGNLSKSQKALAQAEVSAPTQKNGLASFELAPGRYTVEVTLDARHKFASGGGTAQAEVRPDAVAVVWFVVEPIPYPIHFVWYGTGPPSESNCATPRAIRANIAWSVVNFWCLNAVRDAFTLALPGITIRSIDTLLANAGPLAARIQGILTFYANNRSFAPAKDLITYLILREEGGYFFDANCTFAYDKLAAELAAARAWPAFVALPDDLYYDPAPDGIDGILLAHVMEAQNSETYKKTDMWAMFCTPNERPAFATTVRRYVEMAEVLGLVDGHEPVGGQIDIHDTFTSQDDNRRKQRRPTVGALGIQSIFAAMSWLTHNRIGYNVANANWPATNREDEYWINTIGLYKKHGASW